MNIFTEKPEKSLLYADPIILSAEKYKDGVNVKAESFDDQVLSLYFKGAKLLKNTEGRERVDEGQILKLRNQMKRLVLFDDEKSIMLEIEYSECESI